ncbi:unnamed protein product [Nippostrongylus brasiliensis]|uniref:Gnk2-homologous domain-containing protein n=1 Tax=Nippostrongylus brasiliensis TaxID=27835 RepID=A0A0N4XCS6_NIPBR|nr:unnamed protein product [Nippostrongylus brasiliensis]
MMSWYLKGYLAAVMTLLSIPCVISRYIPPISDEELQCMDDLGLASNIKGLTFISCVTNVNYAHPEGNCDSCSEKLIQAHTPKCLVKNALKCLKAYCSGNLEASDEL